MGRQRKLTEEQIAEVFAASNLGKPVKTIAMNHSVSVGTIYNVLKMVEPKQLELDLGEGNDQS